MIRVVAVALLLALGACLYVPGGGGASESALGPDANSSGGPGPGNVPINPSSH